uniref:Prothymosin alpha n=1 Tax=Canis lupus dingo TaxID=286419 RepID=A0A8C0LB23_CANLU
MAHTCCLPRRMCEAELSGWKPVCEGSASGVFPGSSARPDGFMAAVPHGSSLSADAGDLKEKKEVVEEAENGRDAPANGNAENEENGEQEADNEVDEEEEEGGEEEEEEEEGDGE